MKRVSFPGVVIVAVLLAVLLAVLGGMALAAQETQGQLSPMIGAIG